MSFELVVVNDLDLLGTSLGPGETDPPLVVNSDAVLTRSITFELFQPIARRDSQVIERVGGTELPKLPECSPLDARIQGRHALTAPQTLGVFVPE